MTEDEKITILTNRIWSELCASTEGNSYYWHRAELYDKFFFQTPDFSLLNLDNRKVNRIPVDYLRLDLRMRYLYLCWITIQKCTITFDLLTSQLKQISIEFQDFPTIMLEKSIKLVGKLNSPNENLEAINSYQYLTVANESNWHALVHNLGDQLSYPTACLLKSIYNLYLNSQGLLPFNYDLIEKSKVRKLTDLDVSFRQGYKDVIFFASESFSAVDLEYTSEKGNFEITRKYDEPKWLEFWHWWLFEAVPVSLAPPPVQDWVSE